MDILLPDATDVWARYLLAERAEAFPGGAAAVAARLAPTRDRILDRAAIRPGDVVLDVGTGDGLLAFGALARVGPSGHVVFHDQSAILLAACQRALAERSASAATSFLHANAADLAVLHSASVDVIVTRCVLMYVAERARVFREWARVLKPGGRFSLCEALNYFRFPEPTQQLWGFDVASIQQLADKVRDFYLRAVQPTTNPIFTFDERDLLRWAETAGLVDLHLELHTQVRPAGEPQLALLWDTFLAQRMWVGVPTYGQCLRAALVGDEVAAFTSYLRPLVEVGRGQARSQGAIVYLRGQKR